MTRCCDVAINAVGQKSCRQNKGGTFSAAGHEKTGIQAAIASSLGQYEQTCCRQSTWTEATCKAAHLWSKGELNILSRHAHQATKGTGQGWCNGLSILNEAALTLACLSNVSQSLRVTAVPKAKTVDVWAHRVLKHRAQDAAKACGVNHACCGLTVGEEKDSPDTL